MTREVRRYLDALARRMLDILGDSLAGLYLHGSGAQADHRDGKSDLDVLAVTNGPIPDERKVMLATELTHERLPVPAAGLDLMILTRDTVARTTREPAYQLWFSTGQTWATEVNTEGSTSEILILLAVCREDAVTLFGQEAKSMFPPVPHPLVLQAMIDALEWHRTKILDGFHDPLGQHSILNASRNWMHAEERRLGSKADGGRWVLAREPGNELVRNALLARDGVSAAIPSAAEIDAYLQRVLAICRSRVGASTSGPGTRPPSSRM